MDSANGIFLDFKQVGETKKTRQQIKVATGKKCELEKLSYCIFFLPPLVTPEQQVPTDCLALVEREKKLKDHLLTLNILHTDEERSAKKYPFVNFANCTVMTEAEKARHPRLEPHKLNCADTENIQSRMPGIEPGLHSTFVSK